MRITERPEAIIILLSSGIPQAEADRFPIDHYTRRVVIETNKPCKLPVLNNQGKACMLEANFLHGRDIFAGKGISRVRYKQARLVSH